MLTFIRTLLLSVLAVAAISAAAPLAGRVVIASHLECSNGIDDDNDGRADFPQDPDCSSNDDNSEAAGSQQTASSRSSSSSSSSSAAGVSVAISDGRGTVRQGDSLIYVITLSQNAEANRRVDVELTLPSQANTVTPDQGGTRTGNTVRWNNLTLVQGQQQRLTVQINLNPTIQEGTELTARVTADGIEATDRTTVQNAPRTGEVFTASVTDNKQTAAPNERLSYTITVRNVSDRQQTSDVILTVSQFVDVDTIDPSVPQEDNIVVWRGVSFNAGETKTFTFAGAVRRGTPNFASANTQVRVGSATAVDNTSIQTGGGAHTGVSSSSSSSSSARSSSSRSGTAAAGDVLFTKTAGTQEAIPGGVIEYTLFVQNVLVRPVTDAVVNDRFDPALLSVVDSGGATLIGPGQLQWKVPALQPGQTWQQTYRLRVATGAGNGASITTVASISGTGVAYAAVEDRVVVHKTSVVSRLPSTGAAFDVLFLLATLPTAAAAAAVQRRLRA